MCSAAMTDSPSDSDPGPRPEDEDPETGGDDVSPEAASDPEEARREAEEALAKIEALADLDDDPVTGASEDAETDTSSEGASAGTEASASTEARTPEDQCENCGALLHGPYCSQCGQKAADRIVPIWHMINEALEAVFELDLRVLYTLPKFLFLPGRLTKEYINGRRTRYIRPFRLYLFSTFVLFAVLALTTTGNVGFVFDPQGMARLNPPNTGIAATRSPDSTVTVQGSSFFGSPEQQEEIAQKIESDSTNIHVNLYDDPAANEQFERVLRTKLSEMVRNPADFLGSVIDRGPYLMFLMLPIFALLLKLLYVRRGRLYMEHMIFSLHVHAFTFFAFTIGLLLDQTDSGWLSTVATLVELSPLFYLVVAMSHVFDQGLLKSSVKAWILLTVYSVVLTIGFLFLLFVAVLVM